MGRLTWYIYWFCYISFTASLVKFCAIVSAMEVSSIYQKLTCRSLEIFLKAGLKDVIIMRGQLELGCFHNALFSREN